MLPERFSDYLDLINSYLENILPKDNRASEPIYQAMRYSLFAGGKRLRPLLTLAVTESLGQSPDTCLPVAAAVELIHTYSLIHDDLPCMDDDDFRRGKPTNHKVFGEAIAILAGDALLTAAFEHLSVSPYNEQTRCRLISKLAFAAGTEGMIGGQVIDITSEAKFLNQKQLEQLHGMKTGALISFASMAPAIVLETEERVERDLETFGRALGLAFQIIDDVLDVEGQTETLGKTAGKDQQHNKATFASLVGSVESRLLAERLIADACKLIAHYDGHSYLTQFAYHIVNRNR